MKRAGSFARSQRLTIANAILLFVVLIVVLQLWLLVATVNAYLGGDTAVALPAALVSVILVGLNLGLLRYVYRFE
jgi:hypothetical protein